MVSTWTRRDSNPRSLRCERSAFPAKLRAHLTKKSQKNGGNGARTHDLSRVRRTLSRLSYVSMTSILPHFSNLTRGKFAKNEKNCKKNGVFDRSIQTSVSHMHTHMAGRTKGTSGSIISPLLRSWYQPGFHKEPVFPVPRLPPEYSEAV